jgi:hypothetical protein
MPSLAQLYERHADDCARSAETVEDPNRRALLLKLADQWRRDAQQLRLQARESGGAGAFCAASGSAAPPQATRMGTVVPEATRRFRCPRPSAAPPLRPLT